MGKGSSRDRRQGSRKDLGEGGGRGAKINNNNNNNNNTIICRASETLEMVGRAV